MSPLQRRIAKAVGVGLLLLFIAVAGLRMRERIELQTTRQYAEALRAEVQSTRRGLEACLDEVDRLEEVFRQQELATDDLRAEVDSFEALDSRGVPRARYEEYLEAFDRYNESVPEWEARARALEREGARCRTLAEEHNVWVDSLRTFVVEEGLWNEEWLPPRADPRGSDRQE